jgi:catechol 2,3-dioxygenase
MQNEPITDIAHLGHLELYTPKLEESVRFFVDIMGMTESGREGDSVYLRAWDDYERHTLKLTAAKHPGMGHMGLRARSPQALERRVAALKGTARLSCARIRTGTRSSCTTKRSGTMRPPR